MPIYDGFEIIDMTHCLDSKVPTWTGGCGFSYEVKKDYDEGVRVLKYTMHAGVGTHMDAPSHFLKKGKPIGDLALEMCMPEACVLHIEGGSDLMIGTKEIIEWEREHGKIGRGSLVIAATGWEKHWGDAARYRGRFPGFDGEAAVMLVERGVVGVGIDTLSPDGNNKDDFPVHHAVLGSGAYILENLTSLKRLPPKGAHVLALPPKVAEGTEATLRVVALCPIDR